MHESDNYSWNGGGQGASSFSLPTNEGQGRWIVIALVMAILIHLGIFYWFGKISIFIPQNDTETTLVTKVIKIKQPVDFQEREPEEISSETEEIAEPLDKLPPIDELDALEKLPDIDVDIKPEIEEVAIPDVSPAASGAIQGELLEPSKSTFYEPDLPEMGKTEDLFPQASEGQVIVDPGARMAEDYDPDAFTEKLRKGVGGEVEDGLMKEFTTLDAMAKMDGNTLLTSKALIGSDLLFEFNSAELRESARVSLLKVALLIDKHPKLVCWVEGHTDLIGSDSANMELSIRRAMSVKRWLVNLMDLDESRIAVRGFGESRPIVKGGTVEQQAPNRRVEIKMRKGHPSNEVKYRAKAEQTPRKTPNEISQKKKEDVSPIKSSPARLMKHPAKAVLVKPKKKLPKAILVEEDPPNVKKSLQKTHKVPKAIVEPELPPVSKAIVIPEDEPNKGKPLKRAPRKAIPVDE